MAPRTRVVEYGPGHLDLSTRAAAADVALDLEELFIDEGSATVAGLHLWVKNAEVPAPHSVAIELTLGDIEALIASLTQLKGGIERSRIAYESLGPVVNPDGTPTEVTKRFFQN